MKKKKFDCVEMMHEGATAVTKKTSGFTREQELGFWHTRTEALREERKQVRRN
jgi:hypothetical protein